MTMHEGERLAYLQALGITQYVPVTPIPGTVQLPEAQWDVVPAADVDRVPELPVAERAVIEAVSTAVEAVTLPEAITSEPEAVSQEIPQLDLSKVRLDDTPKRATAPKAATLQRFTLAMLSLPKGVRLLAELSHPDAPGFSAVEFRLLADLLLALGIKQDINDSNTRLFRWPMVNNPRIAADASAARDGLLAFLAAVQAEQPAASLVFLGAAPLQVFPHQQLGESFVLSELDGLSCCITHSLSALQQDWTLKPVFWQHLKCLR